MWLSGLILDDSWNEVEGVAEIVCAGIDHVDHVEAAESFTGSDLGRIDGGRRFVNIHHFADFLQMRDGDFDAGRRSDLDVVLIERVEALFLDVQLIMSGGKSEELAASVEVGLTAGGRLRGGL